MLSVLLSVSLSLSMRNDKHRNNRIYTNASEHIPSHRTLIQLNNRIRTNQTQNIELLVGDLAEHVVEDVLDEVPVRNTLDKVVLENVLVEDIVHEALDEDVLHEAVLEDALGEGTIYVLIKVLKQHTEVVKALVRKITSENFNANSNLINVEIHVLLEVNLEPQEATHEDGLETQDVVNEVDIELNHCEENVVHEVNVEVGVVALEVHLLEDVLCEAVEDLIHEMVGDVICEVDLGIVLEVERQEIEQVGDREDIVARNGAIQTDRSLKQDVVATDLKPYTAQAAIAK